MRACKCAWQLETGELVEEEVFLPDGARIDRVIHHQAPPLILPSLPYPSLLSHPITVQEPHEPKPVLQGPPKRHQEAQELRVQVPQGGKCLLARVSLSILFSLILRVVWYAIMACVVWLQRPSSRLRPGWRRLWGPPTHALLLLLTA